MDHHSDDQAPDQYRPIIASDEPRTPAGEQASVEAAHATHSHEPKSHHLHQPEPKHETGPVHFGSGHSIKRPHQLAQQLDSAETDTLLQPPAHHPKAAAVSILGVLAALLVGGTFWYNANKNVYTLGGAQPSTIALNTSPTPTTQKTLGAKASGPQTLSLSLNLKPLSQGHYQAWIVQNGTTSSLGAFTATAAGPLTNLDGSPFAPTVNLNTTLPAQIVITVEAGKDIVTTPSKSVILSGNLQNGKADLKFTAIDLSQAAGVFTLATPTDNDSSDEKSGVWFAHTDGKSLTTPGLTLPEAPAGWKYEAQVIFKGVAVEIGRFSKPDQADEFNKMSGTDNPAPSLPGEDFLQHSPGSLGVSFPTDLTTGEWKVAITVEPDQDGTDPTGSDIFWIQPLSAQIAQGSSDHKEYSLTQDLSSLPTGSAELK